MDIDFRRLIAPEADPSAFEALVSLYQEDSAVRDPGDPLPPAAEVACELFGIPPDREGLVMLAEIDGALVAAGWAKTESPPGDELQVAFADMLVADDARRRGIGTALARELIVALEAMGQRSVIGFPCGDIEAEAARALCTKFGLTLRQEERCSRVLVPDIDESLLAGWEADAATSAPGYRMEQWEGLSPAHLADAWCVAAAGMEDAPQDDVEHNPSTRDAKSQRAADQVQVDGGYRIYRSLALSAGGDPAGMSAMYVHQDRPQVGHQSDTAVVAAHRGHGIGRWLKAANYRLTRAAHPELAVIETYNAQSNPWMLDINIAMGFRPHRVYTAYQGSLDEARRRF